MVTRTNCSDQPRTTTATTFTSPCITRRPIGNVTRTRFLHAPSLLPFEITARRECSKACKTPSPPIRSDNSMLPNDADARRLSSSSHAKKGDGLRAESTRFTHGSGAAAGAEARDLRLGGAGGVRASAQHPVRRWGPPTEAQESAPSRGTAGHNFICGTDAWTYFSQGIICLLVHSCSNLFLFGSTISRAISRCAM